MALQGRKEAPGVYQLGIYSVERERRAKWVAHAVGRGTIGDGYMGTFRTLDAAHRHLAREGLHE